MVGGDVERAIGQDPRRNHTLVMGETVPVVAELYKLSSAVCKPKKVLGDIVAEAHGALCCDSLELALRHGHNTVFEYLLVGPLVFSGVFVHQWHVSAILDELETALVECLLKFLAARLFFRRISRFVALDTSHCCFNKNKKCQARFFLEI